MRTKYLSHSIVAIFLTFIFPEVIAAQTISGGESREDGKYRYIQQRDQKPDIQDDFTGISTVVSNAVEYGMLPSRARKFLEKHCDGHAVIKCEKILTSGGFRLQLADGIEFDFDSKGNVIDTEAPEGYSLSSPLLKAILPGKLYHLLIHNGFGESVEAVHRDRSGYRIDVSDPIFRTVSFDPSGILTLVVND